MRQQRALFLVFGITAMVGSVAREARAEFLTLSVFAGTDTSAPAIYSVSAFGSSNAVNADTLILNGNLAAAGFGSYSFTNLGGASNNPGTSLEGGGAFLMTSGIMQVSAGGAGEGTPITVVLSEDGFALPADGKILKDTGQASLAGISSGSMGTSGTFADATGMMVSTPTGTLTSTGLVTVSSPLGNYVTPFSLTNQTTLSGISLSRNPIIPGALGFLQTESVAALPEPGSVVLMLIGMPLVMRSLLRRRNRPRAGGTQCQKLGD